MGASGSGGAAAGDAGGRGTPQEEEDERGQFRSSQRAKQAMATEKPACDCIIGQGSSLLLETQEPMRSPSYVGSYGKIAHFLQNCLDNDMITAAKYSSLMDALEDLTEKESGAHVDSSNPFFASMTTKDLSSGLPFLEVQFSRMGSSMRLSQSSADGAFADPVEQRTSDDVNTTILVDTEFNCRTRRDLKADVITLSYAFKRPYNLEGRYSIDMEKLQGWIEQIARLYIASNPYHNWMHAFDVCQWCYAALVRGGAKDYFNFQDILALLTSAIAHDVAHPGQNTAFLVSTGADLAMIYNDRSPLENMHASTFFRIMREPELNFLDQISKHDFSVFRAKCIECILCTDMTRHFEIVDRMNSRLEQHEVKPFVVHTKFDRSRQLASKEDRRLLMQAFLHTADLGHCTRPWSVHAELVISLEEEFFRQGDTERSLGLPIQPMMDRTQDSAAKGQVFFLDKLVMPLLLPLHHFVNLEYVRILTDNLETNKTKWADLVAQHGPLSAAALVPKMQA